MGFHVGGTIFPVSLDSPLMKASGYLAQLALQDGDIFENEAIKTPELFRMVVKFCDHHELAPFEEIPKPLRSNNLVECGVSEWDADFVNIEQAVLFELILIANFLDMRSMLDLSCAKVASMIKGKNTEEIR